MSLTSPLVHLHCQTQNKWVAITNSMQVKIFLYTLRGSEQMQRSSILHMIICHYALRCFNGDLWFKIGYIWFYKYLSVFQVSGWVFQHKRSILTDLNDIFEGKYSVSACFSISGGRRRVASASSVTMTSQNSVRLLAHSWTRDRAHIPRNHLNHYAQVYEA